MTEQSSTQGSSDELRIGQNTQVTLHFALRLKTAIPSTAPSKRLRPRSRSVTVTCCLALKWRFSASRRAIKRPLRFCRKTPLVSPTHKTCRSCHASQFVGMELSEGLLVIFNDAANTELPGVVKAFDDEQVTIDFNHPLAGKTLSFEVEIFEVKAILAS